MPVNVYTTFDDPSASAGNTQAYGINSTGQISGSYSNASGAHGFLYSGNRTRVPLLWTRATRCCLRRNQPRSNEITATERKFLHGSSVGCWHAQQAATPPVVPETRTSRRAIWDHRHHTNFVRLAS